jgi:transcriptional regulator with XRE-family HTH domain
MAQLSEVLGKAIGERIRALRRARGLTQAQLAVRARTFRPIICRIESGRHVPDFESLRVMARALGLDVFALLLVEVDWHGIDAAARASLRRLS